MFQIKKTLLFGLLICLIALGVQSFKKQDHQQEPKFKNLKVLPADISREKLDEIMDNFKVALGVKCGYCHAPSKDNPRKMDMASDDNPKKDIARDMMRMSMEINQKFFADSVKAGIYKVSCATCHHGKAEPDISDLKKDAHQAPPPPPSPAK